MPRALVACFLCLSLPAAEPPSIHFKYQPVPFQLENSQTAGRNAPETMAGGVAIFDYNRDGKPDIFFTNGANIETLKKDAPKFHNRLFRNDGEGVFTDVTDAAGLAGTGYDIGVAVGDFDNDGYQDVFVAGVHHNSLYHNNGNGTFTDVTAKAGLGRSIDPEYGPIWSVAAAWVDVNNDGLLDLFVVNYVQWKYVSKALCDYQGTPDYCHPRFYKGMPNQLFLNKGNGRFEDVSTEWGIRQHVGKGMGVGAADYDLDGRSDLFVPNDGYYNFLFHNLGNKFEEVAMNAGVGLTEDGNFVSGMGLDFRDANNDGFPDITFVALNGQTFPLFQNTGKGDFKEVTGESGLRTISLAMSGFGSGLYDLDNDGWKDLFIARGHVGSLEIPGHEIYQHNSVFHNPGAAGKWTALSEIAAGLDATPIALHRGCAFGDLNGDGKTDVVVTALARPAEIWINDSAHSGHWLDIALEGTVSNRDGIGARIKVTSASLTQYNHMTTSVGYASSSAGPVHFGMGRDARAEAIEIRWPSGIVQTLKNVATDQTLKVKEPGR
jgi:enediyne biosynthesis protein E4